MYIGHSKIARKRSENNSVEKLNIWKRSEFPGREVTNFRREVTIVGHRRILYSCKLSEAKCACADERIEIWALNGIIASETIA